MFSLFSYSKLSPSDAARLARIEQKLDLLPKHLNIEHNLPSLRIAQYCM